MTRYDAITLAALVRQWAGSLQAEIDRLDAELPVRHEIDVSYRWKAPHALAIDAELIMGRRTYETHPHEFERVETTLPLAELDSLREIASAMAAFADSLVTEDAGEDGEG